MKTSSISFEIHQLRWVLSSRREEALVVLEALSVQNYVMMRPVEIANIHARHADDHDHQREHQCFEAW